MAVTKATGELFTYDSIEAMFKAVVAEERAWPLWKKAYIGVRRMWNLVTGKVWNAKVWLNRRSIRGYADFDVWEYASQNSRRAVKLLTEFKKLKYNSHPVGIPTCTCFGEENSDAVNAHWLSMVDDMIFFHRVVCSDEISHHSLSEEGLRRYRRGKFYYFRYYEGLWN